MKEQAAIYPILSLGGHINSSDWSFWVINCGASVEWRSSLIL